MHRSGVNPTDWKSRRGGSTGGASGAVDPPQVPGQDGAGVVDAIGAGVDGSLLGRRVWVWEAAFGRREGTAAESALVPARQVVPLPGLSLASVMGPPCCHEHGTAWGLG